jgi:hypothetical protein
MIRKIKGSGTFFKFATFIKSEVPQANKKWIFYSTLQLCFSKYPIIVRRFVECKN